MYTVILYRNGNAEGQGEGKLNIDKFRFLFAGMEQEDRLALYKLNVDINLELEHIIQKIDIMVGTHRVWKLMIFDGEEKLEISQGVVRKVNDKLHCLIKYYAQSVTQDNTLVCRCYPDEIWYIGWMEKRDIIGMNELVTNKLGDPSVANLRIFSMIAEIDSQMGRRFSEFMACYDLLTLAINQFPAGFLSSCYLYFIELEIDRKLFGEYVNLQYENILQIEGLLEAEIMKQQKQRKEGVPCPEYYPANVEMPMQDVPPDIKKLKQRIKWRDSEANIEYALNRNSVEIRGWMYYPRGVMSGKVDKLSEALDGENMSRAFLDIPGKDKLEREKWAALEELSIQNRVTMDQRSFEYELRRREECIKKRTKKRITFRHKILPYAFLAVVEAGFVVSLRHLIQPSFINVMDWKRMLCTGAISSLLTVAVLEIASILSWQHTKRLYINFLEKEMEDKTGRMHKYLQDTLKRVAKYQYYIRLNREQQELQQNWVQQNKRLEHHKFICRQSMETAKQMRYFLDEDEHIAFDIPGTMPVIDFMEEPQEISEYWFSKKSKRSKAELNTSGYMMETMSGFITRFKCVKDIRQLTLDSQ